MSDRHWFYRAVEDSFRKDIEDRRLKGIEEEPHLRGGTSGIYRNGEYYGACPRVAALRYEGHDIPIDEPRNTYRQFAGGYANEDIIYDQLVKSGISPSSIRREGEIPVEWYTETELDGKPVKCTGRPDLVLLDEGGRPDVLFELKTVVSMWSAIGVHYDLKPKSDHLIQAAYYSAHVNPTETVLVYSNRAQFHLSTAPRWMQNKFEPGAYDVQFKDDGTPMKILAFDRVYQLTWSEDDDPSLSYYTEGMEAPQQTFITRGNIKAYYEGVVDSLARNVQLPRPTSKGVDGSKSYSKCQYCPLSDVCDTYENDSREVWKDHAIAEIANLEKEESL